MAEGLATYADGLCQGLPNMVVARDVLRQRPTLTSQDVTERFATLAEENRSAAYVLAASLIDFIWTTRGREGFKHVWSGADRLWNGEGSSADAFNPALNVTHAWRAHVERVAGSRAGISAELLRRHGCG